MLFSVAQLYVRYDDDDAHMPVVRLTLATIIADSEEGAIKHSTKFQSQKLPDMELYDSRALLVPKGLLWAAVKHWVSRLLAR